MAVMTWDADGSRLYETGIDHVALYLQNNEGAYDNGVAWNGVSQISESPSGGESNKVYADNITYLDLTSKEEFGASVEAYTYPDEWAKCDGTASVEGIPGLQIHQQTRARFGLAYRTKIANDVLGDEYGYKLHIIWNCKASPSERSFQTMNESPEAVTFSYTITTTEVVVGVGNLKPTSHYTLECKRGGQLDEQGNPTAGLQALLNALYGTESSAPYLPTPAEVISLLQTAATSEVG